MSAGALPTTSAMRSTKRLAAAAATAAMAPAQKRVKGDFGEVEIAVPRDREGSFEPKILPKHERRFAGSTDAAASGWQFAVSRRWRLRRDDMAAIRRLSCELSEFPASQMDEAMEWYLAGITTVVGGANATWIEAKHDPNAPATDAFRGWRPYSQSVLFAPRSARSGATW